VEVRAVITALALLVLAAVPPEPEFEASLETETPEEGWARSGFRLGLGYEYEGLIGVDNAPGGSVHSVLLRAGAKIDDVWSLFGSLRYGVIPGERAGLRFGGAIEPTFQLVDGLTLSLGVGVGGFILTTGAATPEPGATTPASVTLTDTTRLLGSCSGAGVLAIARVEYLFVLSGVLSMGPHVSADGQWTRCVEALGRTDPDTGEAIELRQFWEHHALSLGWTFWWR